jgi:protein-glucosylgalactosylhydroxylysine glucosidase
LGSGVWTETPTGGATNFITGAGGFVQAVLFGFPGARLGLDTASVDLLLSAPLTFRFPTLVPGAGLLRLRGLRWRQGGFDVTLRTGSFSVAWVSGNASGGFAVADVSAVGGGSSVSLVLGGESAVFELRAGAVFELRSL